MCLPGSSRSDLAACRIARAVSKNVRIADVPIDRNGNVL